LNLLYTALIPLNRSMTQDLVKGSTSFLIYVIRLWSWLKVESSIANSLLRPVTYFIEVLLAARYHYLTTRFPLDFEPLVLIYICYYALDLLAGWILYQ
jgi:hypothetical protein